MPESSRLISARPHCHVVLSPHLDDAVLSLGGSIHRWVAAGERVLVVSVFTADPPPGEPSPFAIELHRRWGVDGPGAYACRRKEDQAALARLGAQGLYLGLPDCIYRQVDGAFLYVSEEALFAAPDVRDGSVRRTLVDRLRELARLAGERFILYAPLSVGGHVDHRLVREAAEALAWPHTLYYEDFPYCAASDDAALPIARMPPATARPPNAAPLVPGRLRLEREDVALKVRAAACYESQIGVLFGTPLSMALRMWRYARWSADGAGYAELLWRSPLAATSLEAP